MSALHISNPVVPLSLTKQQSDISHTYTPSRTLTWYLASAVHCRGSARISSVFGRAIPITDALVGQT